MTRDQATRFAHNEMAKYPSLAEWHIRLTTDATKPFLGLCSHKDKCIILNAHHIDIHPEPDIIDTIRHELAHALVGPFHGHNEVWKAKAKEVGCTQFSACSTLSMTPEIIDAIRSGAEVKVEFEEEIIRRPKYQITRLQDRCPFCNKVAVTLKETTIENPDPFRPNQLFQTLECGHTLIKNISKGTPFHTLVSDAHEVTNCMHEWEKNQCMHCGHYRPFDFQLEGMRFIERALAMNKGAAIFDEMGLGKTIQALGYLAFHPEAWPVLYVVKSGIKFQWYNAILTWLGVKHAGQIFYTSKDWIIPNLNTYIIGYDMLIPKTVKKKGKVISMGFDIDRLLKAGIKTMILDECQQIKNPDSSRTQQVRKLAAQMNVIALSGTPWKNRGSEFYSVLNMMAPMKFPSFEKYKRDWVSYYFEGTYTKEGGIKNVLRFKEYIKDIAIRRERTEVMKELPLINRMKLPVELSELEANEYNAAEAEFVEWYNNFIIGGEEPDAMNILAKMSRMRHLTGLAKIPATEVFLEEFIENTDKKIVVFVHHQDVGQILLEKCKAKFGSEMPILELTGAMSGEYRFDVQTKFNQASRCILIASTLAAGEGLNLQTCADCIMHEPQWNPQNEEQAEGRFIRIGQTATSVNATYVEALGSIDDHFGGIRERKRLQFHEAMNHGEIPQWDQSAMAKELAAKIVENFAKKKRVKPVAESV